MTASDRWPRILPALQALAPVTGPDRSGNYRTRCLAPGHQDAHASLDVHPERGYVCRACGAKGGLRALAILLGLETDMPPRRAALTVEGLAADKRLPTTFLRELGLIGDGRAVRIPYRLADGSLAPRQRKRTALRAGDGSSWYPAQGSPVPYGLWRLLEARTAGYLLLLEGESDTWTAWFHGLPALGIPGANMAKLLEAAHLEGIPELYVAHEPDRGGETLTAGVAARVAALGWSGVARTLVMPEGLKDLNALHVQAPERFEPRFMAVLEAATPLAPAPTDTTPAAETSTPSAPAGGALPPPVEYDIRGHCLVRLRYESGKAVGSEPLASFGARIVEDHERDNGLEIAHVFVIEGTVADGSLLDRLEVPAAEFAAMRWHHRWGARAYLRAGQNRADRAREAIHTLSEPLRRRVYTHTGFRVLDGEAVYLSGEGAVGRTDVRVELPADLHRFRLPLQPHDVVAAMRASVALLDVAPLKITAPLWAAAFRAPLAELVATNFTVWMVGDTGALKSSLAAVVLSHYGTFPDEKSLGLSWGSSANYLEDTLFALKDSLVPLDDFIGEAEGKDQQLKAARLVRAQGNRTGRGRMTASLETRASRPPRGLLLVTGETYPQGHSIFARTFQVEVRSGDIPTRKLSAVQKPKFLLGLRHAMAGYVQWLGGHFGSGLGERLHGEFLKIRESLQESGQHLRVPEIAAHLILGLREGLAFARACQALTDTQVARHQAEGQEAITRLSAAQAAAMASRKPIQIFLETFQGLILEKRFRLLQAHERLDTAGTQPPVLGWTIRGTDLALLPRVAIGEVLKAYREHQGRAFPLDEDRLLAELRNAEVLDSEAGRMTKLERLGGGRPRVHVLRGDAVARWLGGVFQVPSAMQDTDGDSDSGAAQADEAGLGLRQGAPTLF